MIPSDSPVPPAYAELHCRSNFTFLVGASMPEELVRRAAEKHYTALALTDECSVSGVVRAHLEARECGLHFIVGSEMLLTTGSDTEFARIVFLAQDRRGYGNLCELITLARRRAAKGLYKALVADVEGKAPKAPHLAGMGGCIALLLPAPEATVESLFAQAMWLRTWFGERAWIACSRPMGMDDDLRLWIAEQASAQAGVPIVATGGVLMHTQSRKPVQDVLTAVRLGKTVADCGFDLLANAQQYLRARSVLPDLFPPAWLKQSVRIAGLCTFNLEELRYEYPQEIVPEGETPASHLRKLTYAGTLTRFPGGLPDKVRAQIEHELAIIAELSYEPF
ncbi:PHP domain-containing protein, partial [Variovorax sp. dw_954]|uniref:PHP domain-containing protein n=1 Tax=Variovorax sp. dw_954 TaxID=2720078 RepID=UPI001BD66901